MKAQYPGYCQCCGKKYERGVEIQKNPATGKWAHAEHFKKSTNQISLFKLKEIR